ncbi:hypothetical protein OG233_01450 [Streptomyces sp. NBC_01218]|uniref:hypothetical protein n=1 Tax=Streptomyces sp. NBC_01218 TaxID=2903780 RepID=UPI002E159502|nr:hypothetical protein OG233_01450 [Streptomyces sp. NBC_01218]
MLAGDRQHVVGDPAGGERLILSPVLPDIEFEFMRTTLEPGVWMQESSRRTRRDRTSTSQWNKGACT